jgi:hypothetical protein
LVESPQRQNPCTILFREIDRKRGKSETPGNHTRESRLLLSAASSELALKPESPRTGSAGFSWPISSVKIGFLNEINEISALMVGRESPRAPGPRRGTESQYQLEWLVRTLALPLPGSAFRHFGSFLLFVLIPLVSWKNLKE